MMIQLLRHLHPERDVVGEDKMLEAEEALRLRDVKFINVFY